MKQAGYLALIVCRLSIWRHSLFGNLYINMDTSLKRALQAQIVYIVLQHHVFARYTSSYIAKLRSMI